MKKFIITEEEKTRILEMHQNATVKQYLMEQTQSVMLTLTIPTKNGDYIDTSKNISFSIGPLGNNAANEYTGIITTMTLNGQVANKLTNQSLNGEYVNGEIMMNNASAQLVDAIQKIVSGDLIDQSQLNRYSANFVRKPNPKDPSAAKQQNIFIQKVIKKLVPSQ